MHCDARIPLGGIVSAPFNDSGQLEPIYGRKKRSVKDAPACAEAYQTCTYHAIPRKPGP